jgi:hypothetical protein
VQVVEPGDAARVIRTLDVWWAIAGGWAIDLWLGRQTREHHDVEVSMLREDQARIRELATTGWELSCIDPPGTGWRGLTDDELLLPPSFQLKAKTPDSEFDVFLESTDDEEWIFRRDRRVHRSCDSVRVTTASGFPVIAPEVQLLYMAKDAAPKHEHDFNAALSTLDASATRWLSASLALAHPDHRWRAALRNA